MEDSNKKNYMYKAIMLIVLTAIITFMFTSIGMYNYLIRSEEINIEAKLNIVKNYLERYYIGEVDENKMLETAIKGYVDGVDDEYTEYLTKAEYEELLINVTGDYVGIGIYMTLDVNDNVVVLMPIENSPAIEADIRTGDIIVKINGEECNGLDLDVVSSKIKGEEGTTVEIEILRDGETITKTVERRTVEIPDSAAETLDGNIGYIQLITFDEGCSEKIGNYIEEFKQAGVTSIIIDLRDNTGGIVEEAIKFSELFISSGNTIMRTYNKTDKETVIKSSNANTKDIELVVLVNEYSASATEIVAAALKDNDVATIVGTTTFGKGVMQEIKPLFSGALKVTIEEFKTPNGNKINENGVEPDVVVEDDLETENDEQLEKAIELIKHE